MVRRPVAVVTGASRGLGRAVALRLVQMGAGVVLVARGKEGLEAVCREIQDELKGEALTFAGDVSDPALAQRVVQGTLDRFGRLDALVNNAGILEPVEKVADSHPQRWRYNIEVNLTGPYYLTREAIPALRETEGRVVNISTGAALRPIEAWSAYCVSKAGLTHLTRVLALEEPRLTVVSLRPGVVDTEMQALIRREGPKAMTPERAAYFQNLKDQGELEPPEVPARSVAWLALHAPHEWSGELINYDDERIGARSQAGGTESSHS